MAAITCVVTDAGYALLPSHGGIAPVELTHFGLSQVHKAVNGATTGLHGEFKRLPISAGESTSDNTIALTLLDASTDVYPLRAFGLYASDGTLFAVYSQSAPIANKTDVADLVISLDVAFAAINAAELVFGDTNFLLPAATTSREGLVELATDSETAAKADTTRAVTPKSLWFAFTTWLAAATADVWRSSNDGSGSGLDADLLDGQHGAYYRDLTNATGTLHSARLSGAYSFDTLTLTGNSRALAFICDQNYLMSLAGGNPRFTFDPGDAFLYDRANDSLLLYISNEAQLRVSADGYVRARNGFRADGHLVWHAGNDGSGSGSDSDLLDGYHGTYYRDLTNATGTLPSARLSGAYTFDTLTLTGNSRALAYICDQNFHMSLTEGNPRLYFDPGDMLIYDRTANKLDLVIGGTYRLSINAGGIAFGSSPVWHAGNDGSGSGSDSDLLDGQHGIYYRDLTNATGTLSLARLPYTPVQQGTGVGQMSNTVKIGWKENARLGVSVDSTDIGEVAFHHQFSNVWRSSNDGSGSGLDADLWRGQTPEQMINYARVIAALGYTPVQQGTGIGQTTNEVRIGKTTGLNKLRATVSGTDFGNLLLENDLLSTFLNIDGSGSGTDADMLDGLQGADYVKVSDINASRDGYSGTFRLPGGLVVNYGLTTIVSNDNAVSANLRTPLSVLLGAVATAVVSNANANNWAVLVNPPLGAACTQLSIGRGYSSGDGGSGSISWWAWGIG